MGKLVEPMFKPVSPPGGFKTLKAFYPFYLGQHLDPTCRRLHIVGTSLVICIFIYSLLFKREMLLWCPVAGYSFAWVGHFFFERNRPATFTYPIYSLICDFIMFYECVFKGRPIDERPKKK